MSTLTSLEPIIRRSFFRALSTTCRLSAGHNKWSKIKHKKGAEDAKKSAIYGKASRDILVAVRNGGSGDPEKNHILGDTLKKARASGVPKDTIEAALARATRGREGGDVHLTFEALAVNGTIGLIIECVTDNQNRTLHNIRDILTRNGAQMAPVGFMFERKGHVRVAFPANSHPHLESTIERTLGSIADDFDEVQRDSGTIELKFTCPPAKLAMLAAALTPHEAEHEVLTSELAYIPKEALPPSNDEVPNRVAALVEQLEQDLDCLRVWTSLGFRF